MQATDYAALYNEGDLFDRLQSPSRSSERTVTYRLPHITKATCGLQERHDENV